MAQRFTNDIDLDQNALINALMHPLGSDPVSPVEGQLWYRSDLEALRLRQSAATVTIASGGGISSLVEDTTPQLGGQLDVNGNSIGDGTRELLTFVEDPAAVNQLEIENEATGGGPILRATGDDVNVDMDFQTKGSGAFNFEGDITVTGTVDGRDIATDGTKLDGITGTNTGDEVQATETVAGIAELATQAETDAGTDDLRIVTPLKLDALNVTGMSWYVDDDTMASASATTVPSSESVVAYVASQVAGVSTYQGGYDAATNTPDLDTSPSGVSQGDMYTVTVAGTFFTTAVEVGDVLIAEINSATVEADWTIVQRNLDQATETVAGIAEIATQAETDAGTDDARFVTPAKLAAYSGLSGLVKYTELIGDGATNPITVTHNLGTQDVIVSVRDETDDALVGFDATCPTVNTTVFTFGTIPTTDQFSVSIIG